MSLTGQTCLPNQTLHSQQTLPVRPAPGRWISRHRAAIEATATMTLAMSAPILAAVATLQTAA
ncbi:MAG TPA: hypothetical protein VKQ70_01460 [Caulobacteraceae bacterium]|nr:hypothetical protein [Caulobacteraceae bacterium]